MTNILLINLGAQFLIFISMLFQPSYFGVIMNILFALKILFGYNLIASAVIFFIRLVGISGGKNDFTLRAVLSIVSIIAVILSIFRVSFFGEYHYKISTSLYLWAQDFPIRSSGMLEMLLSVLFFVVSWKELALEQKNNSA